MQWLGSATEGGRALSEISRLAPDIVVQTLVLQGFDGFALIERVCALPAPPAVIVTSHMTRECCIEECIRLGASHYLVKPVPTELLIRRIRDIRRLRGRFSQGEAPGSPAPPRSGEIAGGLLREIGMNPTLKGYGYLIDAALAVGDQPRVQIARDVYPKIARKFGVSAESVERAVRHAIEAAWTRAATEKRSGLFGEERPTNRRMILALAREIEPLLRAAEPER